jgi:hypothetical protein
VIPVNLDAFAPLEHLDNEGKIEEGILAAGRAVTEVLYQSIADRHNSRQSYCNPDGYTFRQKYQSTEDILCPSQVENLRHIRAGLLLRLLNGRQSLARGVPHRSRRPDPLRGAPLKTIELPPRRLLTEASVALMKEFEKTCEVQWTQ